MVVCSSTSNEYPVPLSFGQVVERLRPLYQLTVSVEVVLPCDPSRTEEEDGVADNTQVCVQDNAEATETAAASLTLGKPEIKDALVRCGIIPHDVVFPRRLIGTHTQIQYNFTSFRCGCRFLA